MAIFCFLVAALCLFAFVTVLIEIFKFKLKIFILFLPVFALGTVYFACIGTFIVIFSAILVAVI